MAFNKNLYSGIRHYLNFFRDVYSTSPRPGSHPSPTDEYPIVDELNIAIVDEVGEAIQWR